MDGVSERRTARDSPASISPELRSQFQQSTLPRHLALFYQSPEAQLTAAATYVDYGLRNGRRCLYLVDDNTREGVISALTTAGIDVDARTSAGDLRIRDAAELYLEAGFDPDRMIGALEDACGESVDDGYDGLLVAGENTWCFHTEVSFDHVLDFEAEFDAHCPDLPITALCQYDVERFNESSIAKAIWTHERIVYRGRLCTNPYYLPPEEYRDTETSALNARLMLEQTHELARARREVERREQRLSVVNRVLRHNVRNEMNVVGGLLERLRAEAELSPEGEAWVDTAMEHLAEMVDTADRGRYVQESLGSGTVERVELDAAVARAIDRAATASEAAVSVAGDTDVVAFADSSLDDALTEAVRNVTDTDSRDHPRASIRIESPNVETVRIDVAGGGTAVPKSDRRALRRGEETPLEHANGLGLWFVKWIVENSRGKLTFPDDGGKLRIELPRAR